jgi:hypothetical protein
VKKRQRLKRLAWSEYLPLAATAAMWGVVVLVIGHADTARLLAAITMIRAIQNLTKLSTPTALKRRIYAPKSVRRQAKRYALALQLASLAVALIFVALLAEALKLIGQHQIAAYLPYIALGMPARCLRLSDVRTASPYFRMALAGGGFAIAAVAWAAAWPVTLLGLVFGLREWIAYVALRWWPREPEPPKYEISDPLNFEEVARYSAILGRRMLTYRLAKSLLTVFGPFGNAAARTGRGLNFYRRIEPYLPHHFGGFVTFSAVTIGAAIFVAVRSGEPAAMILAAGLLHIGATTANIALLWNYLPSRGSESEAIYDDDE